MQEGGHDCRLAETRKRGQPAVVLGCRLAGAAQDLLVKRADKVEVRVRPRHTHQGVGAGGKFGGAQHCRDDLLLGGAVLQCLNEGRLPLGIGLPIEKLTVEFVRDSCIRLLRVADGEADALPADAWQRAHPAIELVNSGCVQEVDVVESLDEGLARRQGHALIHSGVACRHGYGSDTGAHRIEVRGHTKIARGL